jgi:tetratricopeptide (TPR) repeat protein
VGLLVAGASARTAKGQTALPPAIGQEAQRLDAYLAQLGLVELRLAHLQQRMRQSPSLRKSLADAIGQVASEALAIAASDPPRLNRLLARLEQIAQEFPETRTPAVELVRLQGEFQEAEADVVRWLEDPTQEAAREAARQRLAAIVPRLARCGQELTLAADQLEEQLESSPHHQQQASVERQLAQQRALAAKADYFQGWSAYYLAAVAPNSTTKREQFSIAQESFIRFLDLGDSRSYQAVSASELGLASVWRSRAVVGLGLAEIGLGNLASAEQVLGWLEDPAVPPAIRDQTGYWHVQGLLVAGRLTEAAERVEKAVADFSESASAGKSSLCLAAIRTALSGAEVSGELRRRLVVGGVRGLARMRQFTTLEELIAQHRLEEAPYGDAFPLAWLRGRRIYLAAEKSRDRAELARAKAALSEALAMEEARRDRPGAAQARYYLAWTEYRLGAGQAAARAFHDAAAALRDVGSTLAAQAAWMQCVCLSELAESDPRHIPAALFAVATLKRDYPQSAEVRRAEWLEGRLRRLQGSPDAALAELAAVAPSDERYAAAQAEICELRYQQWQQARAQPQRAAELAQSVVEAAQRLIASTPPQEQSMWHVRSALRAVAVLRAGSQPQGEAIARWLARVEGAAQGLDPSSPVALEYQFRTLELAQERGDAAAAQRAAQHLAEHGRKTPYEAAALVVLARLAEEQAQTAEGPHQPEAWARAEALYARLVDLLGETPERLTEDKNAAAAASRLAWCHERLGRWPEAADRLDRLVATFPKDRTLLERAGRASFEAGRYAQALAHWRTLLAGLPAGSEAWFEAKYYQVACLAHTDRAAAQRVLRQLEVLYPEVPSEVWRARLRALRAREGL